MSVELANAYWTSAGPVEVHFGREWSLYDFAERCAQAAEAGFVGLGLWHADIEHQLETRSFEDMRRDLDDNGLRCYELEFIWDWFVDDDDRARRPTASARCCSRRPPRSTRITSRPATSPARPARCRASRSPTPSWSRTPPSTASAQGAVRVHAVRREREQHRRRRSR